MSEKHSSGEVDILTGYRERIRVLEEDLEAARKEAAEDCAIQYRALCECDESELSPDAIKVQRMLLKDRTELESARVELGMQKRRLEGEVAQTYAYAKDREEDLKAETAFWKRSCRCPFYIELEEAQEKIKVLESEIEHD